MGKAKKATVGNSNLSDGKKKKKNVPARPQPAWLFPVSEEGSTSNPKNNAAEQTEEEDQERMTAVKFLKHHAATAPVEDVPPGQLTQLVGAFLAAYGFDSTSRMFTAECDARKTADGWKNELSKKLAKNTSSLVKIFENSQREVAAEPAKSKLNGKDESSASESDEGDSSSDDSSSDDSDSEEEEKNTNSAKKAGTTQAEKRKREVSESESDSDSDSDSSSSGNSGTPAPPKKRKLEAEIKATKKSTATQASNGVKAEATKVTKAKAIKPTTPVKMAVKEDSDSDSDSSDDSSSDEDDGVKTKTVKVVNASSNASTDSTNTLNGENGKADSTPDDKSSDSSESSEDAAPAEKRKPIMNPERAMMMGNSASPAAARTPTPGAKASKKTNEPFSRIPKNQYVDPRLSSNKYVPYDYAQKAHEDLIVTKGKGFTKEKNKKKRGSYRGGLIDTSGGKAIIFDD